ncbi:Sulfatase [Hexamita inflata]|uniref:Sulfatase n=1 Tax=Hexamita inflata TaxID=28002 RepID=A0AA86TL61_9EUKA|nr:Sulfatase [Hexamita inflata]
MPQKSLFDDQSTIIGLPEKNVISHMFSSMLNRQPTSWILIFVTLAVSTLLVSSYVAFHCIKSKSTHKQYKQLIVSSEASDSFSTHTASNSNQTNTDYQSKQRNIRVRMLIFFAVLSILEGALFMSSLFDHKNIMQFVVPSSWNFYRTGVQSNLNHKQYTEAVDLFRRSNQLKNGYDWIDQRSSPEFPTVYAPKSYVCAYNPELEYCGKLIQKKQVMEEPPNVVMIVVESFSPSPMMLQNHVVSSQEKIVNGPLYKEMYLPNLKKISESGLTFSSLSSSGLPTLYGWLSLMTGEIPYTNQINIIKSMLNDVDDFPSFFKQNGYNNMYVAPCTFEIDGQHNWLFRGREVRNKKYVQLKEMPLWFDNIYQYIPTAEQALELNVTQNEKQSWVPDRITAAQFMKHFGDSKKQNNQPLMGVWITADTHQPFQGFDNDEFYEPFKFGQGRYSKQTIHGQADRYATVAKYMDNYVGQVVKFLQQQHNNTIVVLVGDHGAREVPLFHEERVDKADPNSAIYDNTCNSQKFSNDELFVTSGLITYLGESQYLKNLFEPVSGKVVKTPTDHHDMIRTLYDIVSAHTGKDMPSSRNGRNLIELAVNLTTQSQLRKHTSIRTTMIHSEIATEDSLYRFHTSGSSVQKFSGIYPTCVSQESRSVINKSQLEEFHLYHKLYDHVQTNNKQFSYKFRNEACQYPAVCDFPETSTAFNRSDIAIITLSAIGMGLVFGVLIACTVYLAEKQHKKQKKSIIFVYH